MDTAVRDETEQVESAARVLGVFHGFNDLGGLVEFILLDGCENGVSGGGETGRPE